MRVRMTTAVLLLAVLAASAGCASPPEGARTMTVDVPAVTERSAVIDLAMDSGTMRLGGEAANLVEGMLSYAPSDGKPFVSTGSKKAVAGAIATVEIGDLEAREDTAGAGMRIWDLRLNGGLPLTVNVSRQSGDSDLDLSLVDVQHLFVDSTSGPVDLALGGPHPSLSTVSLMTETGDLTVDASGEYPALEKFEVTAGEGDLVLDLSGTWQKDFTVKARAARGNVTITAPEKVNVLVTGAREAGAVSADGFTCDAAGWTRAASKPSDFTLTVVVELEDGDLVLKLPEKK